VWFLAHGATVLILTAVTLGRGSVFLLGGTFLVVSYVVGFVVLSPRITRRKSSSERHR